MLVLVILNIIFFLLVWTLVDLRRIDKILIKHLKQEKELWYAYAQKILKDKEDELEL